MNKGIEQAKRVLSENTKVLYGIFGMVQSSGYFPPKVFLNEFLSMGYDPCDQDARMGSWKPFELNNAEYLLVYEWWQACNPESVISDLNVDCWDEWVQEIIDG